MRKGDIQTVFRVESNGRGGLDSVSSVVLGRAGRVELFGFVVVVEEVGLEDWDGK